MAEDFLPDVDCSDNSVPPGSSSQIGRDREPVTITVVGSCSGVTNIIHRLYALGFAQVYEWSRLQPAPHTNKLISVLTKHIPTE